MSVFNDIQSALRERADLNARLSLIPYEGTPEIKEVNGQKYLFLMLFYPLHMWKTLSKIGLQPYGE